MFEDCRASGVLNESVRTRSAREHYDPSDLGVVSRLLIDQITGDVNVK